MEEATELQKTNLAQAEYKAQKLQRKTEEVERFRQSQISRQTVMEKLATSLRQLRVISRTDVIQFLNTRKNWKLRSKVAFIHTKKLLLQ